LLPEARLAAYTSLIGAEKTIRQNRFHHSLSFDDINFDGVKEALFQSSTYTCYLQPDTASVSELDSLRTGINYACGWNTVRHSTGCFRDSIDEEGNFEEELFSEAAVWNAIENAKETLTVAFSRDFCAKINGQSITLSCRKSYRFDHDFFSIDYELVNKGAQALSFRFCTESEILAAACLDAHEIRVYRHREGQVLDAHAAFYVDSIDGVAVSSSRCAEKLLIRADKPFSLRGHPNVIQRQANVQAGCANGPNESMFEGFSLKLGWDIELPSEGMGFFSLSVRLEQ
jgi:hypothetical protein